MTICIRKASRGEAARAAALAIRMWEDNTLEGLAGSFSVLIICTDNEYRHWI